MLHAYIMETSLFLKNLSKWKTSAPWKAQIMLEVLHATDLFDALQKPRINYMQGVSITSKNLQNKENINNLPVIIKFKHKNFNSWLLP